VLDRNVVVTGLSNSSNCNDLECPWRSFPYCKPFQVRYFCIVLLFIDLFLLLHVSLIYANKYLLTSGCYIYTLYARVFEPMHRVQVCAYTRFKASGLGDKAPWSWSTFGKQMRNLNISKNKHKFLWSFSWASELRIILWRHVDRCQVLSTVDHCLSITLSVQLYAHRDDDWVWQCFAQSVTQDLLSVVHI